MATRLEAAKAKVDGGFIGLSVQEQERALAVVEAALALRLGDDGRRVKPGEWAERKRAFDKALAWWEAKAEVGG